MHSKFLLTALALAFAPGAAQAATVAIPGLYNTGVDSSGTPLGDGAADPHYVLNVGDTPVVYDNPNYNVPGDARFIGAQVGGGYTVNPNTYTLTFSLTGLQASTAQLSGNFEADNYGSIYLNTKLLAEDVQGTTLANFQSFTPFSAGPGSFNTGLNTLTFVITDTGPPSAFAVSGLTGTASAAPEASTWAMLLLGFAGLGIAGLRRRNAAEEPSAVA